MCSNFDENLISSFLQEYLFSLSKKEKKKQPAIMSTMNRIKVSDKFMWIEG